MKPSNVWIAPPSRNEKSQALRRDAPVVCPRCERSVPRRARQQVYCSSTCKERARERARKTGVGAIKNGGRYPTTRAPTNPPKRVNDFNALQAWKSGSSTGPNVPHQVIEAEIFGSREWRQVVSSDGVVCEVSRLRPRTLLNGNGSGS